MKKYILNKKTMVDETLKEKIQWFDTDKTIAKDVIENYDVWIKDKYSGRLKTINKDIILDGSVCNLTKECAIIAEEMFSDIKIKNRSKIKLCFKALAEQNLEIVKNVTEDGKCLSDKYLEEFNEIQQMIDKKNEGLSDLLEIIEEIPDNDWDLYKKWKEKDCMYNRDKDGNITGVNCCYSNLISWLDNFPLTKNQIEYDSVKLEVTWNKKPIKDSDTHDLIQLLNRYLSRDFSNLKAMNDAVIGYSIKRKINNVIGFMDSLPEWDGVDYIEKSIKEVLCCEEIDKYYDLYYAEIKMHCIAFLRRLYNKELYGTPTKYDQILTFASNAQGSGKTTFFERLYNFDDKTGYCYVVAGCDFKPQDKDFVIQAHKNCCLCLDEIDMKRGLVNSVKGFISRQSDEFRLPYGMNSMKPVRGFVITATSNNSDFLKDYTTRFERRWHIIHVSENRANNRNINKAFDEGFDIKLWSQCKWYYENEPDFETWIEEDTELGKKLAELQQGYKFYQTDEDYEIIDSVFNSEYCPYAYTEARLTGSDIVKQYQADDVIEYCKIMNEAIKKKQSQDNYIPSPYDRPFKLELQELDYIAVSSVNEILKLLNLNCTPQGMKNHFAGKWEYKNKKVNGKVVLCYVKIK